jgi:hypothetical protein
MPIVFGCLESNCDKGVIQCEDCQKEDEFNHFKEHKHAIVTFSDYLVYIANEIGRVAAPNSQYVNRNV